jgi:hypothetical protein
MLDLYNNKYNRKTLKENIYAVKLTDILKTQHLDITFIVRYILNDIYQMSQDEKNINIDMVLKYQQHIQKETLSRALIEYDSDEDSIQDFQIYSEKN